MLRETLALGILTILLFFWVIRRTYSFWHGKGIPYLSFTDYMKLVYDSFTKPMHEVVKKNYRRHGRLYGSYQGFVPALVVGDPRLLRDIYVKDFKYFTDRIEPNLMGDPLWDKAMLNTPDEEWKAAKTMISPAFTTNRLKAMVPIVVAASNKLSTRLLLEEKSAVAICEMFDTCAMDTTAALVYSIDFDTHECPDHPMVKCCKDFFGDLDGWKLIMLSSMPSVFKLLPFQFSSKKSAQCVKDFTRHMAQQRLASKKRFDDVLQLCLDAIIHAQRPGDSQLSESVIEDMAAQCMLFFVGGSDAITLTLTWTAYSLALHPECQKKVLKEIDSAVKQNGVTYESLKDMPYLEAVINEALRMYAPEPFLLRKCTQETSVAGIQVRPGMCIEIPMEGIHRDPEFFPEPDSFKPERFLPENKEALVPYTFLAFGAGPRNCIGQRMGIVQTKATLACLLQKIKFERSSETPVPLKLQARSWIPQPVEPMKLKCVPRT